MGEKDILSLEEIREKVFAGSASLEENEKADVISAIIYAIEKPLESFDENEIKLLEESLANLFVSGLAEALVDTIEPEIYFTFGKRLFDDEKFHSSKPFAKLIHAYLDVFRHPVFLKKIYGDRSWDSLISSLISKSNFRVKELFEQRASEYGNKPLLRTISNKRTVNYSWSYVAKKTSEYAAALAENISGPESKVAFLMSNSLQMALLDLSCLTSGVVNVMLPGNSVSQHIEYILNQTKAELLLVENEKQLSKVKIVKNRLHYVKKVVLLEGASVEKWVVSFKEFLTAKGNGSEILEKLEKERTVESTATLMYTSGTTGEPKGIIFKNKNIVFKRFCRAMALPDIGERDRFLSYLPLFHTFGRFLELMGSVFWGAEYIFIENPSAETMISNMRLVQPTIFISIPKKWMELYEHIALQCDIEFDNEENIRQTVESFTGGALKFGLSAAGFLPPEIFKFFQKYGVEVMSGFGMTEATGGITMTPPGKYSENSLGAALPGVEIKLAEDGELLIRGDYVMDGYYGRAKEEVFDSEGWFPTGDVMKTDSNGFIEIIDRKKEIYKNIKGETIAPQKIENFFRDFEFIHQVFLVGDHKPFNALLIHPTEETEDSPLRDMTEEQKHDYYASSVATVNHFLAPFERIIDFRIIARPFSAELGEVTPKGTYKRRVIEKNFDDVISGMYKKNHTEVNVNGLVVKIPNWFLREKGILSRDVFAEDDKLAIPELEKELTIKKIDADKSVYQIGDYNFVINDSSIDLQLILIDPRLWLGNASFVEFTGEEIIQWVRSPRQEPKFRFHSKQNAEFDLPILKVRRKIEAGEVSFLGLHQALLILEADNYEAQPAAVKYVSLCLKDETLPVHKYALNVLRNPQLATFKETRRELLKLIILNSKLDNLKEFILTFLKIDYDIITNDVVEIIVKLKDKNKVLEIIENILFEIVKELPSGSDIAKSPAPSVFNLLSVYGVKHPAKYKHIRRVMVFYQLNPENKPLAQIAADERSRMRSGFRKWLGENQRIAIHQETGEEYSWEDVIIFEEGINEADKQKIVNSIVNTPILRETIFLIANGRQIGLSNILPNGIWISFLHEDDFKTSYRVSVQTDYFGLFDIVLNINKGLPKSEIIEEVNWHCLSDSRYFNQELLGELGALYRDGEIWSAKFISGESVAKFLFRKSKKGTAESERRLFFLWPFFIWNSASLYFGFWRLTGKRMFLEDASPSNFIIPPHDYQTGTRIVSITKRAEFENLSELFSLYFESMIEKTEEQYPFLKKEKIWKYIFSGLINSFGEKEGLRILKELQRELTDIPSGKFKNALPELDEFLRNIEEFGFIPKQLYFAIKRFHRWLALNEDAQLNAIAEMLKELYSTYQLNECEKNYPETRTKFFLMTIFAGTNSELELKLNEIIQLQRNDDLNKEETIARLSDIKNQIELSEREDYFLTRLSYPHIKPSDEAAILRMQTEGAPSSNLVVQYEDFDGNPFMIRKPISPKEISRLHQLFIEANMLVTFQSDHEFLIALSERGFIIGGLFYRFIDGETVYMDKIVVSNRYRHKGVSDKLMNELFNRMKTQNVQNVTTGFFRPEYFYHFGFKIERKYSGLVKKLWANK
ncbi:MAG: GNAT family N-acetyltransferase [Chlorobi bacterium]|nr:GNAT family N-acetyltransferase [Chlorobiota bacterium]